MKTCNECQRPQRGGFYRTQNGIIYCYDCFIRLKERQENDWQKAKQDSKMHISTYENNLFRISQIVRQIEQEGYEICGSNENRFVCGNPPLGIKQMMEEANKLRREATRHHSDGIKAQKDCIAAYADFRTATYCESEDDEHEKFGNVL